MNQIDRTDRPYEFARIGLSSMDALMEDVKFATTIVSSLEPKKFVSTLEPLVEPLKEVADLYDNPDIRNFSDVIANYCV